MTGTARQEPARSDGLPADRFTRAERCQYEQSLRRWPRPLAALRTAAWVARRTWGARGVPTGLGAPSVFSPGDVVRVKDGAAIDELLRQRQPSALRFTDGQRALLGVTMVVDRPVRQMLDDRGVLRPISRAVSLIGATCDIGHDGCGRSCSLLFRDEWLERAPGGAADPSWSSHLAGRPVVVRPIEDIAATLDGQGRLHGMAPPLDADHLAGRAFATARPVRRPGPLPVPAVGDWWVVDGARCSGREIGGAHPCDRRCALVWHRSWLDLEDP